MSDRPFPESGRLMGIDAGERRVGVAVTDELRTIASPVATVLRGKLETDEFRAIVTRYAIEGIIAGLPRGMSGNEGPQADVARRYAESLAAALELPLRFWDERLTTAQAERSLIESGRSRAQRKERIDAVAAALMLQSFIDASPITRRRLSHR